MFLFFLCFPSSFFVFLLCFYMCFFDCKCKSLKRLGKNRKKTERNIKKKQKNSKENRKNRNTGFPTHEPPRINRTNYSRRFVGWKSCISVFYVFLRVFLFFLCFFLFFLFSPSLFKLLHLQSKKHI